MRVATISYDPDEPLTIPPYAEQSQGSLQDFKTLNAIVKKTTLSSSTAAFSTAGWPAFGTCQ